MLLVSTVSDQDFPKAVKWQPAELAFCQSVFEHLDRLGFPPEKRNNRTISNMESRCEAARFVLAARSGLAELSGEQSDLDHQAARLTENRKTQEAVRLRLGGKIQVKTCL